ncbi:MAG: hypothetical protein E7262_06760 [Lachnospiraceae bacterium]|nr:hypothetical protein [Lachnospiraceae bacterium]
MTTTKSLFNKKEFLSITVVQMLGIFGGVLALFIDSLFIGHFYDNTALAAYGLVNPISLFVALIGGVLSQGVQVVCGKAAGQNNWARINKVLALVITLCIYISVVFTLICTIGASPVTTLLGAPNSDVALKALTMEYLIGYALGTPAMCIVLVLTPFYILDNNKSYIAKSIMVMLVVNVLFDYLNVVFFKQGLFGIGIASTISNYASLIPIAYSIINKKTNLSFKSKNIQWHYIKDIFNYGHIYGLYKLCRVFTPLVINRLLMNTSGADGVAAFSIISSVSLVTNSLISGIGSTMMLYTGRFFGEKNILGIKQIIKTSILCSVIINSICIVIVFISAQGLAHLFSDGHETVVSLATLGLRLYVLSMIVNSINYILRNYYNCINKKSLTYTICILDNFVMVALVAIALSYIIGVTGIWLSWVIGQTLTLLYILIYLSVKNHSIKLSWDKILMTSELFCD